ncbi:MAG: cupredoxin domain-containing protein [Acidimicrobiales bacterium]
MRGARLVLAVLAAGGWVVGCGSDADSTSAPGACRRAQNGRVTVVAADLAWDRDCLEGPADEPLTIVVDNQDDGVNHNLHLTDAPDEPSTELEAGPVRQQLAVTLPAGAHEYVCDIHPSMVGTLTMTSP